MAQGFQPVANPSRPTSQPYGDQEGKGEEGREGVRGEEEVLLPENENVSRRFWPQVHFMRVSAEARRPRWLGWT